MLALPSIDSINTVIGAEATQFNITLQSSMDAEAMLKITQVTQQLREMIDRYHRGDGAPTGEIPVPEVEEPSGLAYDEELRVEGLLHEESHLNCDVEEDAQARGGRSSLSEDSEHIQEVKFQHSVRFASSVASQATCKSNASAKYDTMTGEDESRIGANIVARLVGTVDLEHTDLGRFDEFKRRIHGVPEVMDETKKKRGFSTLIKRLEAAMESRTGPLLEEELVSILRSMQNTYNMSNEFAGGAILDTMAAKVIYEQKDPVGLVERVVRLVRAVNDIDVSIWDAFWDHVEEEGRIKEDHYSPGKTSASGPGMELFQEAGTRTEVWSQLTSGLFGFLAAADEQVIDTAVEKKKLFATRDKYHDLWQKVKGDRKLEDCEEWFGRFTSAMGRLQREFKTSWKVDWW